MAHGDKYKADGKPIDGRKRKTAVHIVRTICAAVF